MRLLRRVSEGLGDRGLRYVRVGLLALLAGGVGLLPPDLKAQGPAQLVWEAREGNPSVAFSIHLPVGALADPEGQEGTAFLYGRVLEREAASLLGPLGGQVLTEVTHETFTVTVQVAPAGFDAAWRGISSLLAGGAFSEAAVLEARERLLDEILFEAGAPVRAFELEWYRGLREAIGAERPERVHPVSGTVQGVGQATAQSLQAWRSREVRWTDATVAVVGAVSEATLQSLGARRVVEAGSRGAADDASGDRQGSLEGPPEGQDRDTAQAGVAQAGVAQAGVAPPASSALSPSTPLPPAPRQLGVPAPPLDLAPGGARQRWTSPDRRVLDEEITSTWIGMAWALPRGTPWALRDFLSHIVSQALNPTPPDPGLYRATVRLERVNGTPLLVVVASVDPQSALDWERRILDTLERVASDPPQGAFFDLARRQYRSSRLLAAADPALHARWLARQAAEEGHPGHPATESWGLTRAGLATLADARGAPRILLYGPARMMTPP